jgi:hypothetical protein
VRQSSFGAALSGLLGAAPFVLFRALLLGLPVAVLVDIFSGEIGFFLLPLLL